MKDFWKDKPTPTINKKKLITIIICATIALILGITAIIYIKNETFREWIDINVLRKEVKQDRLVSIEIKEDDNPKIYAFNQNIGILSKNEFKLYNTSGKEEKSIPIEITNPMFSSSGRYLAIAETKGQKLCLIIDKDIAWEKKVDGNISQVHVSKNGYVAVAIVDATYKTTITMYNDKGDPLFNTYLSTIRISDISISNNNKYLAIAEIDTSGIVIESKIEVISIERAKEKTDANNSKIATYTFDKGDLITNIKYQEKDKLVCMTQNKIIGIELDGEKTELHNNTNTKTTFQSIELNHNVVAIEEKSSSLFSADSYVTIINSENQNTNTYVAKSVTKDISTYENTIALNLGTEIEFVNTNGWLTKRYKAEQEITSITLSSNIAGIIYRNKIEIVIL